MVIQCGVMCAMCLHYVSFCLYLLLTWSVFFIYILFSIAFLLYPFCPGLYGHPVWRDMCYVHTSYLVSFKFITDMICLLYLDIVLYHLLTISLPSPTCRCADYLYFIGLFYAFYNSLCSTVHPSLSLLCIMGQLSTVTVTSCSVDPSIDHLNNGLYVQHTFRMDPLPLQTALHRSSTHHNAHYLTTCDSILISHLFSLTLSSL